MTQRNDPEFTLGELLRKARVDAGMEQAELAQRIGVSRQLVSKWERNQSPIMLHHAVRVVRATGGEYLLDPEKLPITCTRRTAAYAL